MKTSYLKIVLPSLLLAGLTVSCDGCKDKKATDTGDSIEANAETTDPNAAYDNASSNDNATSETSGSNAPSQAGRANAAATAKGARKGNGYSAPDGTDAENYDGDMYTKHDTTPQASGPPIK